MALTADAEHAAPTPPAGGLRRLVADEEASAAVEMVVLLPVYMLLMLGLFLMGNLAWARQQIVQAVRFKAWSTVSYTDARYQKTYFEHLPGALAWDTGYENTKRTNVAVFDGAVDTTMLTLTAAERGRIGPTSGMDGDAQQIAMDVLNNETPGGGGQDLPLVKCEAKGSFTYQGLALFGMSSIPQRTTAVVLLPRRHQRMEYQSGQPHPVTAWGNSTSYFDPSRDENLPLSPLFSPHFTEMGDPAQPSGQNPGLWTLKARINGDAAGERGLYTAADGANKRP